MRTGLNHVRAADRPAPSSARIRATSRSNLRSTADQAPRTTHHLPTSKDGDALDDDGDNRLPAGGELKSRTRGDVFINPARVAMVEPSGIGDDNVTDIVVAAQAGLVLVRVQESTQRRRRQAAPVSRAAAPARAAGRRRPQQIPGQLGVGRARGPSPARAAHVVSCALAMTPSRFARRCLVFLLLVAAGAGFLARPAEAAKRPFADIVDDAARQHGVDPDLVHAVIAVESGSRASAQSPAGAQGLMQLMPGTQRHLGVADAFDPHQNVDAGVAYLRRLTDEFGTVLAIAAYNAGPGAVRRYNGIPPYEETHAYVRAVLDQAADKRVPSRRDRPHAVSAAGLAEPATSRQPSRDDRVVGPSRQSAGRARGSAAADERPLQVEGAGAAHAAADTARLVLPHGADRLIDAGLQHRDPANHATSTPASSHRSRPGARSPAADASALPGHFEHLATPAAGPTPDPAASAWRPTDDYDRNQTPQRLGSAGEQRHSLTRASGDRLLLDPRFAKRS